MVEHSVFYYPYASFKGEQETLLKVAALYFDKLFILDPSKASWDGIGAGSLSNDLRLLEEERVLVRIAPEDVLQKYEKIIEASIRSDLGNREFLELCNQSGRAGKWTLALAKVPKSIRDDPSLQPKDASMRNLMKISAEGYGEVYDEFRNRVEYRYADYPLPLGESIMMNHALFGALLHTGSTPITDDPFHNQVLSLKIRNAQKILEIRQILEDRAKLRHLKTNQLAMTALTDLELAILPPQIAMKDILKYRKENEGELIAARKKLGELARRIRQEPLTKEFSDELEHETIPDIQLSLAQTRKMRNKWFNSRLGRLSLKAAGLALGAASVGITLAMGLTPLLPVEVATTSIGLIKDTAIPGAELALDWKKGKHEADGNGLQYLLRIKNS